MEYPTLQHLLIFAHRRNITSEIAQRFWQSMQDSGWVDWNGDPIRSWKGALIHYDTTHKVLEKPERTDVRSYARAHGYSVAQADEFYDWCEMMNWHVGMEEEDNWEPIHNWPRLFDHSMERQTHLGIVIKKPDFSVETSGSIGAPRDHTSEAERRRYQAVLELAERYGTSNDYRDVVESMHGAENE